MTGDRFIFPYDHDKQGYNFAPWSALGSMFDREHRTKDLWYCYFYEKDEESNRFYPKIIVIETTDKGYVDIASFCNFKRKQND